MPQLQPIHNQAERLLRPLLLLVMCCILMPLSASSTPSPLSRPKPQPSTRLHTLQQQLAKATTADARCQLYPYIIDELYSDGTSCDAYRRLFLDDAKKTNNTFHLSLACREVCSSFDIDLIKEAERVSAKLLQSTRIRTINTILRCHIFWSRVQSMSDTQKSIELENARKDIYFNLNRKDRFEEYYDNFRAFTLNDRQTCEALVEPYIQRMYELANDVKAHPEGEPSDYLLSHATLLASDMFVRTSQFIIGRELNRQMIDIFKNDREQLTKYNRHRDTDISEIRAEIRLLICEFEINHKVNEQRLASINTYLKHNTVPDAAQDRFTDIIPLYTAIAEHRMKDAETLARQMLQRIDQEGFGYDFEYDALVTVFWLTGNHQDAIALTNRQIDFYRTASENIDKKYLQEMGLNEQWMNEERQQRLLMLEHNIAALENQRKQEELENIILQHFSDSIEHTKNVITKEKTLQTVTDKNETTSKQARDEQQRLTKMKLVMLAVLLGCLVVAIALVGYHLARLRRANKRLLIEHERLRVITDKANQSNRLKVFFLQNTSHDIRNPLGAISNMSTLIYDSVSSGQDEMMTECAKEIKKNSDFLSQIMNTILDISAIESNRRPIEWMETKPVVLAREIVVAKSISNEKPIEIKLETTLSEDFTLVTDGNRLRQVIMALLSNALKFSEDGQVTVRLSQRADNFFLEVEDTGIGIPEEKAAEIFQPFYKLNEFIPGTGLGLTLCHVICDNLNGEINVDTSYKEGARIVVTLPISQAIEPSDSKQKNQQNKRETKGIKRWMKGLCIAALTCIGSTLTCQAQLNYVEQYDSLNNELGRTKDVQQRIGVLQNMLDLSVTYDRTVIDELVDALYAAGEVAHRQDVMIEAARNAWDTDHAKAMLKKLKRLPDSNEKRCAMTFLRSNMLRVDLSTNNDQYKQSWIQNTLTKLQTQEVTDIHERFYYLYGLCFASVGTEQSTVIERYINELIELAPKLHSSFYYLECLAYHAGYITYMGFNDNTNALNTLRKQLDALDQIEKKYQTEGRFYRDFNRFRAKYLTDAYFCGKALTANEKQRIYEQLKVCVSRRSDIFLEDPNYLAAKVLIAIAMHEGRYKDAAGCCTLFTSQLDNILYSNSTIAFSDEIGTIHLETISRIFEQTGDVENELRARILLCEFYRRTILNMKHYNYEHLAINLKVLDSKLETAALTEEQQRRLLENKQLENEIVQKRNAQLSYKRRSNEESHRLDSMTIVEHEHEQVMSRLAKENFEKSTYLRKTTYIVSIAVIGGVLALLLIMHRHLRRRRKRLRELKVTLKNEMVRAQRSDAEMTTFLNSVRHEVATPLNVIMGMTQQLSMMTEEQNSMEMAQLNDMIKENGDQLLSLINDILNLSVMESSGYKMNIEPFDIQALCDTQIQSFIHRVPAGVQLKAEYDIPEGSIIHTDGVRLRQVIGNLLSNACKYTDEGSITLRVERHDDLYIISVADTGPGINPKDVVRIFDRFEKLGSQKHGAGLGLNISHNIATKLGGDLYVDAYYTNGARFVLKHPI